MRAISIYRALLLVRAGWLVLEWSSGWDSRRHVNSFTLLHPHAASFANTAVECTLLLILVGLWFFRGWARLIFFFILAFSVVDGVFWPYRGLSVPSSFALTITWCVVALNGAIVAMSFLPPVRDVFATQT
jgi:hypothetical protein